MHPRIKKIAVMACFLIGVVVLAVSMPLHATHALEIQYPSSIPGFPGDPNVILSGSPAFGDVFQFIFTLAIWMIGLLAFGALLIFGFLYETSGPNPAKKLAAKQRFKGTLIGVFLLLGFTIILRTINPELATLGNTTFQLCPSGCPTVTVPSMSVKLTYSINSYKDTNAVLDPDPAKAQARYLADFHLTPGLAPCSTILGCVNGSDPRSIEFFQNHLSTGSCPSDLSSVTDCAKAHNINPVFAVAVWREGTSESQGHNSFGCLSSSTGNIMADVSFQDSFQCFINSVNASHSSSSDSSGFINWISRYCDPNGTDPLICHQRSSFMLFLHQLYDNNAASGGSGLGLLTADSPDASKTLDSPIVDAIY